MTATKTYVAQYRCILMTGRQTFFTGRHKCRPFTMLKNTLLLYVHYSCVVLPRNKDRRISTTFWRRVWSRHLLADYRTIGPTQHLGLPGYTRNCEKILLRAIPTASESWNQSSPGHNSLKQIELMQKNHGTATSRVYRAGSRGSSIVLNARRSCNDALWRGN